MYSTVNKQRRVLVWDIDKNQVATESPLLSAHLSQIDIHPDGHQVALSGQDGVLVVMDLATGQLIQQVTAHTSVVRALYWSPDGTRLLTCDDDRVLKLWTGDTIELLATFRDGMGVASSWSPDGKSIATCTVDGTFRIYSAE